MPAAPVSYKLNNGETIPSIGLGTWQATDTDSAYKAVKTAIAAGYRHIDTAHAYGNEKEVGRGIRDGLKENGLKREDIFVTTKLPPTRANPAFVQKTFDESFNNLDIGYIDLYLLHWPIAINPYSDMVEPRREDGSRDFDEEVKGRFELTWQEMEKLPGDRLKTIGVSNFSIPNLERLKAVWKIVPAVNQIELHPYLPQFKLVDYCNKLGIHPSAYSPLGSSNKELLEDEVINEVAKEHKVSAAQILLSWAVTRGSVVPKSVTEERIRSNFEVVDLSDADITRLNDISKTKNKRFICPVWGVPVFDEEFENASANAV